MNKKRMKPSRWYYGLSILVLLVGYWLSCLFSYMNMARVNTAMLLQVIVPGLSNITLSKTGRYTIYYEYESVVGDTIYSTRKNFPGLQCTLISDGNGFQVPLFPSSVNCRYAKTEHSEDWAFDRISPKGQPIFSWRGHSGGLSVSETQRSWSVRTRISDSTRGLSARPGPRSGVSVLSFKIDRPGTYEFSASYPQGQEGPEVVLAIGPEVTRMHLLRGPIFALLTFFGVFGMAVAIAMVTFLKRCKAKKECVE